MKPVDIAWTVCMVLWIITVLASKRFQRNNNYVEAGICVSLEWIFLGLSWVFLGLSRGWW